MDVRVYQTFPPQARPHANSRGPISDGTLLAASRLPTGRKSARYPMESGAMSTRFSISLLLSMMVSAVLFGIGAIIVLSIPSLSEHAPVLLPIVIVLSFVFAPIFAWVIAPKLRARYSRKVEARRLLGEREGRAC